MSKDVPVNEQPFDLDRLKQLIELMEKHGLTEVSLQQGDRKWRLRRGPQEVMHMVPPAGYPNVLPGPAAHEAAAAAKPCGDIFPR